MDGWNTIVFPLGVCLCSGSMFSFHFDLGIVFFLAQDAEGILMKMMMCLKQQKQGGGLCSPWICGEMIQIWRNTLEDSYGSPTNYQFGKEHDLNQTSMIIIMFLIFRGAA